MKGKTISVRLFACAAMLAAAIAAGAFVGCGEEAAPPADQTPAHTHEWTNETEYYVKGGELYVAEHCSGCDELGNEKAVKNGVIVTPKTAQEALDKLKDGGVIYFSDGEYTDTLELRQNKFTSTVKKTADGEEVPLSDVQKTGVYYYYRTLENAVLVASDGAVFTGGIYSSAGHTYGSASSRPYDAVRDITLTDTNTSYYGTINVDGLEVRDFSFEGAKGKINFSYYMEGATVSGLTISDCTFDYASESVAGSSDQAIRIASDYGDVYSDITVSGCSVDGYYQGVYVQNVDNITVTGNTMKNCVHNAIAVQSSGDYTSTGNITISDNTVENDGDRAIRFGNLSDATVSITDNKFVSVNPSEKEIMKAGEVTNVTVTLSGNTVDGSALPDSSAEMTSSWTVSYGA